MATVSSDLQDQNRAAPAMSPSAEANTNAEWIGEMPWWQWSRATGDWNGIRPALENNGLTFAGRMLMDWSYVLAGSTEQRGTLRELVDLNLTYDLKPLFKIDGGTIFAQWYNRQGPRGTDNTRDLQGYDNMDAGRLNQVEEFWYEQKFLGGRFRTKIGQVDANNEFDSIGAASEFINSSAGFSPTLLDFPTYPNPALSINGFVAPVDWFYAGAGAYADNLRDLSGYGFEHPYVLAEAGLKSKPWHRLGPGHLAAGLWHDTGDVARLDSGMDRSAFGCYLLAEQQIWKCVPGNADDSRGLSVFAQYGHSDPAVCSIDQQVGLGISALGIVPTRDSDACGIYWTWAKTSRGRTSAFDENESALEFFYKWQATPFFVLKPDLQWLQHPGGRAAVDDAWVATLRVILIF